MSFFFIPPVCHQAGRFSFIQLIIYIGSTLSYYALVRASRRVLVRFVLLTDETLAPALHHYTVNYVHFIVFWLSNSIFFICIFTLGAVFAKIPLKPLR